MSYSTRTTALDPTRSDEDGTVRSHLAPPVDSTDRVIPWSGPRGWKLSPPILHAKRNQSPGMTDAGFSMVELVVVLLVLAILLAIAIPTFLGTTSAADDRSAQSNLNTALTDAKVQFQNNGQTYDVNGVPDAALLSKALNAAQLSLSFKAGSTGTFVVQGSSGTLDSISVSVSPDGNGLVMGAYSVPGNCFYVVDNGQDLATTPPPVAPYAGTTAVTSAATPATAGTISFPMAAGTFYVEVKGDVTQTDCNASTPRTSGSPATIKYQTAGFPS